MKTILFAITVEIILVVHPVAQFSSSISEPVGTNLWFRRYVDEQEHWSLKFSVVL